MSKRRNLDGVASLQGFLAKSSNDLETTPSTQSKAQTKKKAAFDPRAEDSDSESDGSAASSDSDSDNALPDPASWNRLNKSTSASTPTSQKGITPSKRTPRSNRDEVADSDDGRDSKKTKTKTKKKPAKKTPSSDESTSNTDSSESESEAETPAKKAGAKKELAKKKKADTSSSDTSSSGGSGSESDSDDDAGSKKAAKSLMNGKKTPSKEASSTSSSSSSSASASESSESEAEVEVPAKKDKKVAPKKAAPKKAAPKEATPEESSESEEEASTSAVETEKEPEKTAEPLAVAPPPKKASATGFQSENFLLRPVQGDEDGKDVQDFFAQAKRDGKQLWYFTAPASVPINVIEQLEIPIHKIRNGDPVFKHDGADYGVNVSNEAANPTYQVLIPNKKGVRYEPVAQNVEQVMRIKRIIQVPSPADGEVTPLPLASSRGPRPQPKGLKARYHPIGVSADEDMGKLGPESDGETEDVEMTQAPALPSSSQKTSKKSSASTTKKTKRKAAEVEDEAASSQLVKEEQSALKKKAKKQKRSGEDTPASTPAVASQELQTPTLPVLPAPKSSKKAKKVSFPAPPSSQTSKKETPILPPQVPHRASSATAATPVSSAKKEKKEKKSKSSSATPKSSS